MFFVLSNILEGLHLRNSRKRGRTNCAYDKHHIVPTSRGGSDGKVNLLRVSKKKHAAYHSLFLNAAPREVLYLLSVKGAIIKRRGLRMWIRLFGKKCSPSDAYLIIQEFWMKYPSQGPCCLEWVHASFSCYFSNVTYQ